MHVIYRGELKSTADIDVTFNFTSDSKGYWDGFWDRNEGMGAGGSDPDAKSATLRLYHRLLWSRFLPNGEFFELEDGRSRYYLRYKDIYFSSDSILASFRYWDNKDFIMKVASEVEDFHALMEDFINRSYTMGGMMLLPSFRWCLNQARGCHKRIRDRWDLTMECIRRYYLGEESPLSKTLERSKDFFDLFVDFKGFVDFFFLQDCVTEDYSKVILWHETSFFESNPMPKTVEDYLAFLKKELDFLEKRNARIAEFVLSISCEGGDGDEESEVDEETRIRLRASNIWLLPDIGWDSPRSEIEPLAELYGISYEQAMEHREHWLKLRDK